VKKIIILVIVAIGIFVGLVFLSRPGSNDSQTPALTYANVQQDVTGGAKLYDVRTADEYEAGHFAGAINWSLQDIQAGAYPDVAKDTKIFVYCRSGNRSGEATTLLKNAGYTNVTDLEGLANVEAIGGTLVTGE